MAARAPASTASERDFSVLAIDCGNSRVKWGLHRGGAWQSVGAAALGEIARLRKAWAKLPEPDAVVIADVVGGKVRRRIERALSRWRRRPIYAKPARRQCGVVNGYRRPRQLGADRWAALIGARALVRGPCLVVNAGTATTADILTRSGRFVGGVILPGLELMKRALAAETARLPYARGRFVRAPRSTADAIETGCLHAQAGAIERLFATLGPDALCVLSGGSAARLAAQLRVPLVRVDNLVLEGLVRIVR